LPLEENEHDWRHDCVSLAQFIFLRDFGHFGNPFLPAKKSGLRPQLYDYHEVFSLFIGRYVGFLAPLLLQSFAQRHEMAF